MKLFRRNQSTSAALSVPANKPTQAYPVGEIGIAPATTADVHSPGKALDTDDLVIFLIALGAVWTVGVGFYSANEGWALGFAVIIWAVGGILLLILLLFVQSRTWVQTWASFLHWTNERKRLNVQQAVAEYHYQAERKIAKIQAERDKAIAEIQERLRIEAGLAAMRQVEEHSQPQSHSNQLANYVEAEQVEVIDTLRLELLSFIRGLYRGAANMDTGYIPGGVPWSRRGALKHDATRIERMLADAQQIKGKWLLKMENNGWWLNLEDYPESGNAVHAFDRVHTPR